MGRAKTATKKEPRRGDDRGGTSAPRRRMLPALRIVLLTLGCLLALFSSERLSVFLERSPEFTLQQIRVEGCERIDPEAIRRFSGIRKGTSLISLDARAVSTRLEEFRPVRSATVVKQFPRGLRIRVRERIPALLVKVHEELFYMDAQGVVFSRVRPGDALDLPLVTGLDDYRWSQGPRQEGRLIQTCLRLLRELNSGECLGRLSEIHVDPSKGMRFFLEAFPVPVMIGWEDFHDRRIRLERVLPLLLEQGSDVVFVDLRFDRRVLVKQSDRVRGRLSKREGWERAGQEKTTDGKGRRSQEEPGMPESGPKPGPFAHRGLKHLGTRLATSTTLGMSCEGERVI